MMYGVKGSIKYDIEFGEKKLKIETDEVIEEMRKYPEFKSVMPTLDDLSTLAIVKILITFRRYNFEHENKHIEDIVARSAVERDLNFDDETTILLLENIVRELTYLHTEHLEK